MKLLMRLLAGLLLCVLALASIAYLFPRSVTVTRVATINAPPSAIFPLINSLQQSKKWSPWISRDPDIKLVFSGPEYGVGNTLEWQSEHPEVGNGREEITASALDRHIETELDFGSMGAAQAVFDLQPDGTGTEVTWSLVADMGAGPVGRWMGLMMDRWVGPDYEKGLANLKEIAEAE